MPFPLAHPAAVLPFRRYCPRRLSFPALVAGSLSPDAGYLFRTEGLSDMAHQMPGAFAFGLPMGVALVLVYLGAARMVPFLPVGLRRLAEPLFRWPLGSPLAVVASVLLGVGTHLAWDSFTHKDGWLVLHSALLNAAVVKVGRHTARVCHVLWYLSTFLGVVALLMACQDGVEPTRSRATARSWGVRCRNALLVSALMLPVVIVHHLAGRRLVDVLVMGFSALLLLGFVCWLGVASKDGS